MSSPTLRSTAPGLLLVLAAILGSGCTHTHRVHHDDAAIPETYERLAAVSQQKKARVKLTDGQRALVRDLMMTPDSTSWSVAGRGTSVTVPTQHVARIRFRHRGSGALEGMTLGVLLAAAGSFGLLLQRDSHSDAIDGVKQWIPIGAGVGFLFGLLRGERETYRFAPMPAPQPSRQPPRIAQNNRTERPQQATRSDSLKADSTSAARPMTPPKDPTKENEASKKPAARTSETKNGEAGPPINTGQAAAQQPDPRRTIPAEAGQADPSISPPAPQPPVAAGDTGTDQSDLPRTALQEPTTLSHSFNGWVLVVASPTARAEAAALWRFYQQRLAGEVSVHMYESEVQGVTRYRIVIGQHISRGAALATRQQYAEILPADAWPLQILPSP